MKILSLEKNQFSVNFQQNRYPFTTTPDFAISSIIYRILFLMDPTLISRVRKYLENHSDKNYVNINTLTDDLQNKLEGPWQ